MSVDIVIVGAGGHGAEVASYVQQMRAQGAKVNLLGLVDDHEARPPLNGVRILGTVDHLLGMASSRSEDLFYITAVGDNQIRKKLVEKIESKSIQRLRPWTLRHPLAFAGTDQIEIGDGTCLAPGAIATVRAKIGRHCIVNVKASISHDCVVADFCNLNPGSTLCGNVVLGEGCYVGAGATIKERVSIGPWTTIGAGAVVVDDLPEGVTAVGVPAKIIRGKN